MKRLVLMVSKEEIEKLVSDARNQGMQKLVVGAVIAQEDKALIIRRAASEGFMAGLEEIPSGTVDPGESLDEALHREIREETGLQIKSIERYVNHFDYVSGSGKKTRQFNFLVSVDSGEICLNPAEHSEYKWLSPYSAEFNAANISQETQNSIKLALGST